MMFFFNGTLHNPVFNWVMPIFHEGRVWLIPLILAWLAAMIKGDRRLRLTALLCLIVVLATDQVSSFVLKPLAARIRPCNVLGGLHLWKDGAWMITPDPVVKVYKSSFSFPSSHAANAGGQAFWWSWAYPRTRWWWIVLAFLIGFSRIYDGVHYPFDVLAGWAVGGFGFGVVWLAARKKMDKNTTEIKRRAG